MGRYLLPVFLSLSFLIVRAQTIGSFISVPPEPQDQRMDIPATHTFQVLIQAGDPLGAGKPIKPRFDYTGYVGIAGSSENGYLGINHETSPGGMSILDVSFNAGTKLWEVTNGKPVDFTVLGNLLVPGTVNNCSGAVTPWNTLITCEEVFTGNDLTGDGYYDEGWSIEVNPVTGRVRDLDGDHKPDKIWAMGRMKHENVAFAPDSITSYFGDDNIITGNLYKFVADKKANLSSGKLYVLDLGRETGDWKLIPNTTPAERNAVMGAAYFAGATIFQRIEDVDYGPDGMVYFTSTNNGKIFRFKDLGSTISNFEVFVDNKPYIVNTPSGPDTVVFSWPDNLAFDGEGNLWITQDGSDSHVWVVRPSHTVIAPAIEVFMNSPAGAEPTGITFSPDYRFMFMSFQHPWGWNTLKQVDASGDSIVWNRDVAMVIARKEFLGMGGVGTRDELPSGIRVLQQYPNPAQDIWILDVQSSDNADAELQLTDAAGRKVLSMPLRLLPGVNTIRLDVSSLAEGMYLASLRTRDGMACVRLVHF